ncbi:hypothetical protein FDW83_07510 [Pseudarthrobacter sp. NamE2]|uniref:hypothetical protein n=1 Tax=Pseudarthrobacter sp. NamE2 TaxID=2576838 RepID=UPI0010FD31A4|nr:hypothetical protein [Pseudarthrobacter sp. NamE2]TLM84552.1 hypothetical protein FDW83_07510 [Pseudarthrobacter sp. NamE2]
MTNWVSTWFYTQSKTEGGEYAQVRGDSSTESFRDVYRRCVGVFFLSARKANPDAELVLYLNAPWDKGSSKVAHEVWHLLQRLQVTIEVIPYKHQPPESFAKSWRNQFFVIDVLADLARKVGECDAWVVLDSDIVWSTQSTDKLWQALQEQGISTYTVGYARSQHINGMSMEFLKSLAGSLNLDTKDRLDYSGGEFIGGNGSSLSDLIATSDAVWSALMDQHALDQSLQFEEAHLLSLVYGLLDVVPGRMNFFVRRLWTQPFKYQNVSTDDEKLALWHVPAEKKYGIRRIYRTTIRDDSRALAMDPVQWINYCRRQLGIPRNSLLKVGRDTARAIRSKSIKRFAR